jgi:hypothetical protein
MKSNIAPANPVEVEYKHARILMNAQQLAHPVMHEGKPYFIQCFTRDQDPNSAGLKTYVYLTGKPGMIPASEITLVEQPK